MPYISATIRTILMLLMTKQTNHYPAMQNPLLANEITH